MANIQITIHGIDELSKDYNKFVFDMKNNMVVPLDESAAKYLKTISANFNSNGRLFGEEWKSLETTIAIKKNLMKSGKAISIKPLVLTGKLKRGFGRGLTGNSRSFIFNTQSYSLLHDEGGTTSFRGQTIEIPKRVLVAVDDARIKMVANVFINWLQHILRSNKM